ncbi:MULTISPECIES: DUF742 domain-containing protein [unclassified Kitasatospora]|uniref:DUF742 domain-containing protein n=1 Tax=unclassified Kitasatospora TaxID=2633591 RepID=UPI000B2B7923|nr:MULTISPECIES: DUF742 domain-containing protein [unclassified Kitasatospora]
MTPPDDRSGQYGVPYPGTGHDAFGAPGVGPGQPYGQPAYGQPQFAQQQPPPQPQYDQSAQYGRHYGQPQFAQQQPQRHGYQDYPGPEAFPEQDEEPGHVEEFDDDHDSGPLIRPFAMTGGRTRPRYELALEALVSANVSPDRLASMLPEHQRICTLCTEVKSVAEVSALLNLPLGVARILVADLAEAGLVAIHQPAAGGESGNQPDVTLLERVLSGLRKL